MRLLWACAAAGALGGVVVLTTVAPQSGCSPENWQDCHGKPWVVGDAMETPLGEPWWPHPLWGQGDEAGSTNWYTRPEVVQRAIAEADQGRVYNLGLPYEASMPLSGHQKFMLRLLGTPTGGPSGANQVIWHEEILTTQIGQVGTEFDGLGHIGVALDPHDKGQMRFYNGFTVAEMGDPSGLKKLGVEKLHPIVARGILIDVAGAKGLEAMEAGQEITKADVNEALQEQGMADFQFREGDAVFFRTGWGKYWGTDNEKYISREPGIGMEVATWLTDEVKAGVVGSDTGATEVMPNPDPACAFCVHQHLLARHGVVNQESMNLDELAADGVYTFMYVYSPVPIVGATGSMGAPLAID